MGLYLLGATGYWNGWGAADAQQDYRGRGGRRLDDEQTHREIHEYHEERARFLIEFDQRIPESEDTRRTPMEQSGEGSRAGAAGSTPAQGKLEPVGNALEALRAAREAGAPIIVRRRDTGKELIVHPAQGDEIPDDESTLELIVMALAVADEL